MEVVVDGLTFTSKFDSGNLAQVEKVVPNPSEEGSDPATKLKTVADDLKPDHEVNILTKPDCGGTPYENRNRSWFYFGVRGGQPGKTLRINVMNMNRQGRLYSLGHSPVVRCLPGRQKWERMKEKPSFENGDGNMILSFNYRFAETKLASTVYFAFAYPWSYSDCQDKLAELDEKYRTCNQLSSSSARNLIYYKRELLCHSLDGQRVDLITVSDCHGLTDITEPRIDDELFPNRSERRCKWITGKKVYFVSSRVHPGETPSSFVFNGFLDFILREDDQRAIQLRRQYVFKMIPMLNPDGVSRGHYRSDSRGVNLNRVYLDPSFDLHPSIYAAKTLLVFHHVNNRCKTQAGDGFPSSGFWLPRKQLRPHIPRTRFRKASQSVNDQHPLSPSPRPLDDLADNSTEIVSDTNAASSLLSACSISAPEPLDESESIKSSCEFGEAVAEGGEQSEYLQVESFSGPNSVFGKSYHFGFERGSLASYDVASGGECEELDDDRADTFEDDHRGNEGSDDEADSTQITEGVFSPHLSDTSLRNVSPGNSGIAFYVDLHAHASKRGCFMYGNYLDNDDEQAQNVMFARLMAINSAHFDFEACNFSERNMYTVDRKEGLSKEGSGRVALYKTLGIVHCYTLECNYNTGRMVNYVPAACADMGRATPPPLAGVPPKYAPAHYEEVGRALAVSALDVTESNPWSRVTLSEFTSVQSLREILRRQIQASRMIVGKPAQSKPSRTALKGACGVGHIPRCAVLANRQTGTTPAQETASSSHGKTPVWPSTVTPGRAAIAQPVKRQSFPIAKKDLGPVHRVTQHSDGQTSSHHKPAGLNNTLAMVSMVPPDEYADAVLGSSPLLVPTSNEYIDVTKTPAFKAGFTAMPFITDSLAQHRLVALKGRLRQSRSADLIGAELRSQSLMASLDSPSGLFYASGTSRKNSLTHRDMTRRPSVVDGIHRTPEPPKGTVSFPNTDLASGTMTYSSHDMVQSWTKTSGSAPLISKDFERLGFNEANRVRLHRSDALDISSLQEKSQDLLGASSNCTSADGLGFGRLKMVPAVLPGDDTAVRNLISANSSASISAKKTRNLSKKPKTNGSNLARSRLTADFSVPSTLQSPMAATGIEVGTCSSAPARLTRTKKNMASHEKELEGTKTSLRTKPADESPIEAGATNPVRQSSAKTTKLTKRRKPAVVKKS